MARYVDGYVLPIPKKNVAAYKKMATVAARVWRDHGALEYRECVGDDMNPGMGVPFTKLADVKRGETVVFAWIVYKSRAHRDRVNAAVMKDERMLQYCSAKEHPFELGRMAWGGFKVFVAR